MTILRIRIQGCGCNNCGRNMYRRYLSVCILGRYYEFLDSEGFAKIATLRSEKIARFWQNLEIITKNWRL